MLPYTYIPEYFTSTSENVLARSARTAQLIFQGRPIFILALTHTRGMRNNLKEREQMELRKHGEPSQLERASCPYDGLFRSTRRSDIFLRKCKTDTAFAELGTCRKVLRPPLPLVSNRTKRNYLAPSVSPET